MTVGLSVPNQHRQHIVAVDQKSVGRNCRLEELKELVYAQSRNFDERSKCPRSPIQGVVER
jgi:hypothetical protein